MDGSQRPRQLQLYPEDPRAEPHDEGYSLYAPQNQTQDNLGDLSSIQGFQSTKSTMAGMTPMGSQLHLIN